MNAPYDTHRPLPGHRPPPWEFLEDIGRSLGFAAVGIASTDALPQEPKARYQLWLDEKNHGRMDYMERHRDARNDPRHPNMVPQASAVISVALSYAEGQHQEGLWPLVAAHARARDYHLTIKDRLEELASQIKGQFPNLRHRSFVDSAPVMERSWAVLAGLGQVGRNGYVMVPGIGPRVLLGELIIAGVPHPGPPPSRSEEHPCGSCRRCIDACPSGALCGDGTLQASRCLAYHTTADRKDAPSPDVAEKFSMLYGCDICTAVCPQQRADAPCHLEPAADSLFSVCTRPSQLLDESKGRITRALKDTPMNHAGPRVFLRMAQSLAQKKGHPDE